MFWAPPRGEGETKTGRPALLWPLATQIAERLFFGAIDLLRTLLKTHKEQHSERVVGEPGHLLSLVTANSQLRNYAKETMDGWGCHNSYRESSR